MKLTDLFPQKIYNDCVEQIQKKQPFLIRVAKKPYYFDISFRECSNGCWKDDLMICIGADYLSSGFRHPMDIDEFKTYKELCKEVDNFWASAEKLEKLKGEFKND